MDPLGRYKNRDWRLAEPRENITWDRVQFALLMDIRDELQALVRILRCPDTQRIPRYLRDIRRNTTKKKRVRKVPA